MSVHLNITRGTGLNKTTVSYRVNVSGSRGAKGEKGDTGDQGPEGPAGTVEINTLPEKAVIVGADIGILEDSEDGNNQKKWSFTDLLAFIFARVATFFNYQAPHTSLTPADATTATVNVVTKYDYTITPSGASFTLALSNIPASGIAWSVTIYAIDWDGVTVAMPSGSATPDSAGLSFTSGGGKDRLVLRGNSGPSGEKEFYNLPGNMG